MTSAPQLITFDLDDTLWDVRPALQAAERAQWSCLTSRFPNLCLQSTPRTELDALRRAVIAQEPELVHQISLFRERFIYALLCRKGVSVDEASEAASEAFAAFLSRRHAVKLFDDALPVLRTLKQHFKIGAITNGNADVHKTEIGHYFDYAWRAEEFGISKPDPALFHQAFSQAGVTAQDVIHIGDCHENDVGGAVAAGATAIWFKPEGGQSEIAASVVTRLAQLPSTIEKLVTR